MKSVEEKNEGLSTLSWVLFFFVIVTWIWNSFVVLEEASWTDNDGKTHAREVKGIPAKVAYGLNGMVLFLGLVLLLLGMIDWSAAEDECKVRPRALAARFTARRTGMDHPALVYPA